MHLSSSLSVGHTSALMSSSSSSSSSPVYVCCVCQQQIYDFCVYECDRRHFHKQCLKCQMCLQAIEPEMNMKLYAIDGLLVCFDDYIQIKSVCKVCQQRIERNDYLFKTRDNKLIHMKCMSCHSCRQSLERGDKYVITPDNRLLCHKCCHHFNQFNAAVNAGQHPTSAQTAPPAQPQTNGGGRRGRKRANNNNQ